MSPTNSSYILTELTLWVLRQSVSIQIWDNFFLDTLVKPTDSVKNLGMWFDSESTFSRHVQAICKSCFIHVRDLQRLRHYVTQDALIMATNALIRSCSNYCNSLFRDLSAYSIMKLLFAQNSLARIVTNSSKYSHIIPV